MENNSPRGILNLCDWKKIGKGLLIALAGAALTYLQEQVPHIDFGSYTALVVALNSSLVNAAQRWLSDHSK